MYLTYKRIKRKENSRIQLVGRCENPGIGLANNCLVWGWGGMQISLQVLLFRFFLLLNLTTTVLAENSKPLFVVMGGFGTCSSKPERMPPKDNMYFSTYSKCLVTSAWPTPPRNSASNVDTIYSCFTNHMNPEKAEFQYAAEGAFPKSVKTSNPFQVMRDFANYVKRRAGEREVIFIGHSHGGWGAMRAALHYPNRRASFFALDPVSRVGCPPSTGYQVALSTSRGVPYVPPDCRSFPSDFNSDEMQSLFNSGRKISMNIFAGGGFTPTPLTFPHSGLATVTGRSQSEFNLKIPFPNVEKIDNRDPFDPTRNIAHNTMTRDFRTWVAVRTEIQNKFGVMLQGCNAVDAFPPRPPWYLSFLPRKTNQTPH